MKLPETGRNKDDVLEEMIDLRTKDADWRSGKTWSLVYHAGETVKTLRDDAYELFSSENALSPSAFPSVQKFENEVVSMTGDLLNAPRSAVGNMTSGGTESILLAVYTAREYARDNYPEVETPEIVLPETAHPSFAKAAHYFSLDTVRVETGTDYRADVERMRSAISDDTVMVVGSAPSYPHGVIDPIEEIGAMASNHGILCHVDSCIGGFMLGVMSEIGYSSPSFGFEVPGVTSVSVDPHKYGYTTKGGSVILYRNPDLREKQYFAFNDWPGGLYSTPNLTGTRPAGPIAGAWAVMQYLGEDGYQDIAEQTMETTERLLAGIDNIEELAVVSDPDMSLLAFESIADEVSISAVQEELESKDWVLGRNQQPPSIHLTVMYHHADVVDEFIEDLRSAVETARSIDREDDVSIYGSSQSLGSDDDVLSAARRELSKTFQL